ncbi:MULTISPECIES: hypothetical protein [Kitasatospora]|uniref:Repetin n=1 Tax=Kitasatospora setae (strain ATCC 33774 / DSM 43861 / JCM 3304 / KCC A-0304 / NBRC 14216 / KM-6054) TaxID=452652 RepID=E4N5T8_KITSK|nr:MULTISPECIES: hypothetical protein [Kitasatospora]BAJ26569.1 hypothetical protein KSE_07290 [Kitasatospora setae KM-6054]
MSRRTVAALTATLALTGLLGGGLAAPAGAAGQSPTSPNPILDPISRPETAAEAKGGSASGPASVTGTARIFFAYSPDDDIRFGIDAHSAPWTRPLPGSPFGGMPTDATGTIRISHHVKALDITVTAEGQVDCLVTGGPSASLTAVITRADPEVAGWVGKRIGLSVLDGHGHEPDRLGFSWAVANEQHGSSDPAKGDVGTCMALAPFTTVREGGFRVRPADLAPLPPRPTAAPSSPAAPPASTPPTAVPSFSR